MPTKMQTTTPYWSTSATFREFPRLAEDVATDVVVVGAGRKQPAALIVPDWENLNEALVKAGEKSAPKDREALSKFPPAIKLVQRDIAGRP